MGSTALDDCHQIPTTRKLSGRFKCKVELSSFPMIPGARLFCLGILAFILRLPLYGCGVEGITLSYHGFKPSDLYIVPNSSWTCNATDISLFDHDDNDSLGRILYPELVQMKDPVTTVVKSFTTSFVFQISVPKLRSTRTGSGLAFIVVPDNFSIGAPQDYMGLLTINTPQGPRNYDSGNHTFGVEFGYPNGNQIGVDLASKKSTFTFEPTTSMATTNEDLFQQVWIDYFQVDSCLEIYVTQYGEGKPATPQVSKTEVDLSFLKEYMYIGFQAAAGRDNVHNILAWNFSIDGDAPPIPTDGDAPPIHIPGDVPWYQRRRSRRRIYRGAPRPPPPPSNGPIAAPNPPRTMQVPTLPGPSSPPPGGPAPVPTFFNPPCSSSSTPPPSISSSPLFDTSDSQSFAAPSFYPPPGPSVPPPVLDAPIGLHAEGSNIVKFIAKFIFVNVILLAIIVAILKLIFHLDYNVPGSKPLHFFLAHAGGKDGITKNFTEWLYKALKSTQRYNIEVFFDRHSLPKAQDFPEEIRRALNRTDVGVVIVTEEFFKWKWPMIELLSLVDSKKRNPIRMRILPLFYKLKADDVRAKLRQGFWDEQWRQMSTERHPMDVEKCREAVEILCNHHGIEYNSNSPGHDSEYIDEILKEVINILDQMQ